MKAKCAENKDTPYGEEVVGSKCQNKAMYTSKAVREAFVQKCLCPSTRVNILNEHGYVRIVCPTCGMRTLGPALSTNLNTRNILIAIASRLDCAFEDKLVLTVDVERLFMRNVLSYKGDINYATASGMLGKTSLEQEFKLEIDTHGTLLGIPLEYYEKTLNKDFKDNQEQY